MNLLKISQDIGVSVRQLKKVVKEFRRLGYMPAGDRVVEVSKMKNYLSIGANLPVEQLLELLENPGLIKALGAKGDAAKAQLEVLGNPASEDRPNLFDMILDISAGQKERVEDLAAWIKQTIPAKGCTFHYLAVRVALSIPEDVRGKYHGSIRYAFLQVRKLPSFEGWFTVDRDRKRPQTLYHPLIKGTKS